MLMPVVLIKGVLLVTDSRHPTAAPMPPEIANLDAIRLCHPSATSQVGSPQNVGIAFVYIASIIGDINDEIG
jgi:hypothetical protein